MESSSTAFRGWSRLKAGFAGPTGSSRLARAALWGVAGGATSRVLTLAGSFLVARAVGQESFGKLGMVLSTFTVLGMFASFGLGMTATRFISLLRVTAPERAGRIAAFCSTAAGLQAVLFGFGILLAAPWLARTALDAPALTPLLRMGVPLLILGTMQDTAQGILAGLECFRTLARVSALAGSAVAVGMALGAVSFGLPGCIWGMGIGMSFGYAMTLAAVRAELRGAGLTAKLTGWRSEAPALWRFALPAMLSGSAVVVFNWLAATVLVHQPDGYEQLGIFNAANQWRMVILYVPGLVATAGLPVLTHLWQDTPGSEYLRVVRLKMLLGFASAALVALPAILGAPIIMAGYGHTFANGTSVLVVLAASAIVSATLNMIGQALVSEGRMWTGLMLNMLWAAVLLLAARHWIPSHGALGLAWAFLAATAVHFVTVSIYFVFLCRRQYALQ